MAIHHETEMSREEFISAVNLGVPNLESVKEAMGEVYDIGDANEVKNRHTELIGCDILHVLDYANNTLPNLKSSPESIREEDEKLKDLIEETEKNDFSTEDAMDIATYKAMHHVFKAAYGDQLA